MIQNQLRKDSILWISKRQKDLLGTLEKPSELYSLALSVNVCCMSVSYGANYWIVDSGSTDHMTYSPQLFPSYTPSPSCRKIIIANSLLATFAGYGDIYLSSNLFLKIFYISENFQQVLSLSKG